MSDTSRRLFLHLGPAKTGTSAVQRIFRDIEDPHLTYPKTGQWPDGSHNLLALSLQGLRDRGPQKIPDIDALMPLFLKELADAPGDALVSSEILCTPVLYQAFMTRIADVLSSFDKVITLFAVRHPIERAASSYNQMVKDAHVGLADLPDDYLAAKVHGFRITPLIRHWSSIATNPLFLPYHPKSEFLSRFCTAIGRPDLTPSDPGQANRSLSGKGLALLLLGNRHLPNAEARSWFFNNVVRVRKELQIWKGPSFPFSRGAVEKAMATGIAEDLVQAREAFGIDLTRWTPPEAIIFSDEDAEMIRDATRAHLPGAATTEDLERILGCFRSLHSDAN